MPIAKFRLRPNHTALLLAALLSWPALALASPPLQPGQALPELTLKDQHDQAWKVSADTKLVLFAAGRKASNLVQTVLADQPAGFLATRQAVYLADLSRMPGFVTRTFALPALREMPFVLGVVLDEALLKNWPRQDGAVTLIALQDGRVSTVSHASSQPVGAGAAAGQSGRLHFGRQPPAAAHAGRRAPAYARSCATQRCRRRRPLVMSHLRLVVSIRASTWATACRTAT
jgi:hypothetical protein